MGSTSDSFISKVMREGKYYSDPIIEITDQIGIRIILHYPSDIDDVCKIIDNEFDVSQELSTDKRSLLATDQFGYLSVHKIVKLKGNRSLLREWESFKHLQAEVQIRTVLQHSWAAISHELHYKMEKEIPSSFRRKLIRLSGLLELADEEFQDLRDERKELQDRLTDHMDSSNYGIELNLDSFLQYVERSPLVSEIVSQVKKIGFNHLQDDSDMNPSDTLIVASAIGIGSLEDLDGLLAKVIKSSDRFFSTFYKKETNDDPSSGISGDADHWIAVLLTGYYSTKMDVNKFAIAIPWSKEYLKNVLNIGKEYRTETA